MNGGEWRAPDEIALWREPGLCPECGLLHDPGCPWPVTEPPPGLAYADGRPTPLGMRVEDAANCLIGMGWWEPDDAGLCPNWMLAGLAEAAADEPCGPLCFAAPDGLLLPGVAAEHFLRRIERDWERTWPLWACDCGRAYKVHPVPGGLDLYLPAGDGLPGDPAGEVHLDHAHGTVKRSDACPSCGQRYASTMTDQARPQQVLFAEPGAAPSPAAPPSRRSAGAPATPGAQPALF